MKQDRFSNEQKHNPAAVMRAPSSEPGKNLANAQNDSGSVFSQALGAGEENRDEASFVPSPDEVARLAYFSYLNEGSRSGSDVQHWLAAEDQLRAERKLTRSHAFQNRHN